MKRALFVVFCAFVFLGTIGGCEETESVEESLEVNVLNGAITVDTYCDNGGCEDLALLAFTLRLDMETPLPENDEVTFLQYRIDYTLTGVKEKVPYFSAPIEVIVHNNDDIAMSLQVAGSRQRAFLKKEIGTDTVMGTGKVTLAGYDEKDNRIDYTFGFNIHFGDFTTAPPSIEE